MPTCKKEKLLKKIRQLVFIGENLDLKKAIDLVKTPFILLG